MTSKDLEGRGVAMNIVNQLGDLWKVPVDIRQATNDQCDDFVTHLIEAYTKDRVVAARINEHSLLRGIFEMVGEPLPERTAEAFDHRTQTLEEQLKSKKE